MREIKFRAFCEVETDKGTVNEMLYFDPIECDNGLWFNAPDNAWHINEYFDIMQFTGLQDKNGKDIYEGDILSNGFNATGVMKFNNGMFVCDFVYNNKLPKYNQEKCTFRIYSINMSTSVIGNIHENPELL